MTGTKNFILGFILSFCGVTLGGQLYTSAPSKTEAIPTQPVNINLFKNHQPVPHNFSSASIFANIQKETLSISDASFMQKSPIENTEGIEDEEIISITIDDTIPIEFGSAASDDKQAEVTSEDSEDSVAMLPTDLRDDETFDSETPWAVAKGAPNMKNKRLLEDLSKQSETSLFTDEFTQAVREDKNLSYKVAEKIKQSIIFPIPDEILNDENLTPTFIHDKPKKETKAKKTSSHPVVSVPKRDISIKPTAEVKVDSTSKKDIDLKDGADDKNLLNSISSWFSNDKKITDTPDKITTPPVKKAPPAYSSQGEKEFVLPESSNDDLASFYESLQETKKEHIQRKIIPSELKLSFQPNRAEISGTTLQWLKQFSEATLGGQTFLQVRLDASTSTELQKKRLNLLYTIFMNNGVDLQKVDTVFLPTEPNTFIIRTIRVDALQ